MPELICPVCGGTLSLIDKSYVCEKRHCYDIAKSGYVNLLMDNRSGKRHGDDAAMIKARRDFLDRGFYEPLMNAVCDIAQEHLTTGGEILDCGCGDCYYTAGLMRRLEESGKICGCVGIDISKDALKYAAKRKSGIILAAASAYKLPVPGNSCNLLLNIFSPLAGEEFLRVLKTGGALLKVVPLERHLMALKEAIYDEPYENKPEPPELDGFELVKTKQVKYPLELPDAEAIAALFMMTPYYYKTGRKDQEKVAALESLRDSAEFEIRLYVKKGGSEKC